MNVHHSEAHAHFQQFHLIKLDLKGNMI